MNFYPIAVLVFGVLMFYRKTNGQNQCKDDYNTITSCDGSEKSGGKIHVKLNRPCSCTVNPLFSGELLVTVFNDASYQCSGELTVSLGTTITRFNCEIQYPSATTFDVTTNETFVSVRTHYSAGYASGNFTYCLVINQNGILEGIVNVTCGKSATNTKSTIPTTTTTTTTTKAATTSILKLETTTTIAATTFPLKPEPTTTIAATTFPLKPEPTTTIAATTSPSKPETTTTIAATTTPWKPETSSSTTTYKTTNVVDSSPQKSTYTSSDNVTYITAGAAAGALVLVVVVIVLVSILVLRKKKGRKNNETQRTDEASEHTNRAFDENNCGLPDNPLYHSAQPIDKVGYSSVQKNQLGLPPTEATNKNKNDPNYDVPTNNRPINNADISPVPVYAVPNKSGASSPEGNEPQAMYAQVSKPSKSTTPVQMQPVNQDGLVNLEPKKDASCTSVNENTAVNNDGVLYAEINRN